jgi:Fur family transcriptional regulator, zinc uptake regulator
VRRHSARLWDAGADVARGANRLLRRQRTGDPDFLLEHGFVHGIESLTAYPPCEHRDHPHHGMLLICAACGRSEEVEDDDVMRTIAATAVSAELTPQRVTVEAQGLCGPCAKGRPSP